MNLAAARDAVYLRTGYDPTDTLLTPERVSQCLRSALRFIASEHDWDWLQDTETLTTTANQNYVTPGETWIRTLNLTGPDDNPMTRVPWGEFRGYPTTSQGTPNYWSDRIGRLYLWPVPDGAYALTHDFIRTETSLQQDTDEPRLPEQFQDGWIEYASHLAFRRRGEPERAVEALTSYQEWQRVTLDNRRRSRGPFRVQVRPGGFV